ncbi:hypothetical protein BGX23_005551 [Mortierella sp. AD031]|nr:hypothetical protein BGX23_005551 [Mortierella sp. AD031]
MYAKRPKVLIVGVGLGGLTLGAILQKSDIPYEIFERAPEEMSSMQLRNKKRELEHEMDFSEAIEMFSAGSHIVARPMLYNLLLRQISNERIHLGKKILSTKQGGNGVLI